MSNNFETPETQQGPPVNCQVIGIKEGSAKRELLFESTDFGEFEKAYKYYYKSGEYTMVLKEFNGIAGGII